MDNVKKILKKYGFVILILTFAILKQLLVTSIPITPYPNQVSDDGMMVEMAKNIRAGNWLGEYNSNTLIKGPGFPFILAIINYFGLSYINVMNLIYTISCIYFIYQLKGILKTKKSLLAIYVVLLFNPVSYAWWTLQRVYRNGITLAQVLFVIGSLFSMYKHRKDKKINKMVIHSIIGGISLATMYLTREDGIWILPYVIVVIGIIVISTILDYLKKKKNNNIIHWEELCKKLVIAVLPIIILYTSLHTVRIINYAYYGVYEYSEINSGYFGKVIKTIYSIKTDEDIPYVTVTRKKMNMLYEYSPTLDLIKPEIENCMDEWDYNDRNPGDTQVEDGWFWWSLKDAVEKNNYYNDAKTANEFYKNIYTELNTAIKDGKLETQMTMPSNLMSPFKGKYILELPKVMLEMTWYIINFNEVKTVNVAPDVPNDVAGVDKFEAITNDLAVTNVQNESIDNTTKYSEKYVKRLNNIGALYKATGLIIAIISAIAYIILTIRLIKTKEKRKSIDMWLLLTGVICSYFVLVGGVSYSHISAFFSKYYMYLSGAYPLIGIFSMGSICYLLENINTKKDIFTTNKQKGYNEIEKI